MITLAIMLLWAAAGFAYYGLQRTGRAHRAMRHTGYLLLGVAAALIFCAGAAARTGVLPWI